MASIEDRRPFSPGLMSCITPILIVSLVVKPTPYRKLLAIPILGISYYLLYCTTTGDVVKDLSIGGSITPLAAAAIDYIVLTEPQTQLFRLGQKVPSSSFASLWERVKWALDLLTSHRGIGWAHEPTAELPPPPFADGKASRWRFVAYQLLTITTYFLLWDVCAIYTRDRATFAIGGPPLSSEPFFWKCVNVWAWGIPAMAALSIGHSLVSIVLVSLGVWQVAQWRPFFGSFKEAYTIRRLWSRTWHQSLRRVVTIPGRKLQSLLSIPRGTKVSSCLLLYTSFFVSAWLHHPGDYMMLGRHGGALKFFISQAFIITFEDSVITLAKKNGLGKSRLWRILGYLWVQTWFAFLIPVWIQPQVGVGLMEKGMGLSVILGLWKGNWTPGYPAATGSA